MASIASRSEKREPEMMRELGTDELDGVSGGASMTEYALLLMALLTATVETSKK
jgi:hypothetical protein